jgi:hypothetical protein
MAKHRKHPQDTGGSSKPSYFQVNEEGTIFDPDVTEPKTNGDLFDYINSIAMRTPKDLIGQVEDFMVLLNHFRRLAREERDDFMKRLKCPSDIEDKTELERMTRVAEALEDEDEGWKDWIVGEGKKGLPRFKKVIEDWLTMPINWDDADDLPDTWSRQGSAKEFFEDLESDTAEALGVDIIEGENPANSYYAAELRSSIADANKVAQKLGLPFRFRKAKD